MPKYDPVKIALADLVFESARVAFAESNSNHVLAPAHEPLQDCIIEMLPISDLEVTVRVVGSGRNMPRYFSIKVQEQR